MTRLVYQRTLVLSATLLALSAATPRAEQQPPSAPTAAVDALIREGAHSEAIERLETEARQGVQADLPVLQRLAQAVLREVAQTWSDPAASVEACLTLLLDGPQPCEARLTEEADRSVVTRLRLRARQFAAATPQSDRALADATASLQPRDWVAVVDAAPDFPPALAVRLLTRALAEDSDDVRFGALDALSRVEHPSALPVLKTWATRQGTPGRFIALAAVARSGDRDALTSLKTLLPDLFGQDLLAAGAALAAQGDPAGLEALHQVLRGPEELLHLEAAAALAALGEEAGRRRLDVELRNPNVWIRLRALEKIRGVATAADPAVWGQMDDSMPWVRVRAAQATLDAGRRSGATAPR